MGSSLEFAWQEQSVWSQVANRLKRVLQRSRRTALALGIAAAALSTTAAGVGLASTVGKVFAFLGAACVGVAAIVQTWSGPKQVRDWTRARSVSEAIKSEVYLALAGFGRTDLDAEVERISGDAADLQEHRVGVTPKARPLPAIHDVDSYLAKRVDDQIGRYYDKRAGELKRSLGLFRTAEIVLAVVGVLLGTAAGTWELDGLAVWVPVATTIGAAVTAHVAAERYSYLLVEYSRTANELRRIRDRRGAAATLTDEQLVRRAEEVISIENEGWMARLTGADQHPT